MRIFKGGSGPKRLKMLQTYTLKWEGKAQKISARVFGHVNIS